MKKNTRKMRGGFWDNLSNIGTSISQSAQSLWNKTKSTFSGSSTAAPQTSYIPSYTTSSDMSSIDQTTPSATYGGKRRRRHVKHTRKVRRHRK